MTRGRTKAPKKCRDPRCGPPDTRWRPFPIEGLPASLATLVESHGGPTTLIECLHCFSVSAGDLFLGHRRSAFGSPGAEEMVWKDAECGTPRCLYCELERAPRNEGRS